MSEKIISLSLLGLIIFCSESKIKAATINVNSIPTLQTAINNASNGDIIILANGTYLNNTINVSTSNITVQAATNGGVFLNGTNDINITGNFITFTGFQFTSGNIGTANLLEIFGSNNTVSQLNFNGYSAKKYIEVKAGTQYNEISFCNIEAKPATAEIGCTIQVSTSFAVPGYHKIRYCSFQNFLGLGGDNGNEPIRIGLSTETLNNSRTVVEFCFFNNTGAGDSESVSVKSRENTIRFCTFTNQQNAMLVFRNGDNNVAYSNFFINAGGIRIKEANNIFCYNNYFQNAGVGSSAEAVKLDFVSPNLNNINFIHNTFVNCGFIDLGNSGPTNNTWANNIFQKASGNIFKNANTGTAWAGNIYQGSLGITIASGMSNVNPLLTTNSDGYQGLSSTSPAINAASASYPTVLDVPVVDDDATIAFDISGQARPTTITLKDVGCDEFTTGPTPIRPLVVSEVGPAYLGGPALPIKLQSFEVIKQNNKAVIIWVTSTEQNSNYFEIQKSTDGINFSSVGNVHAAGNSSTLINYSFSDPTILKGVFYYRLKQVDKDGKYEYSVIKKISFNELASINIYPNPAKNFVVITFPETNTEKSIIGLYNVEGKLIKTFIKKELLSAINTQVLNIADVANGTYILTVKLKNVIKQTTLIIQK